jgi:hypothetical protein
MEQCPTSRSLPLRLWERASGVVYAQGPLLFPRRLPVPVRTMPFRPVLVTAAPSFVVSFSSVKARSLLVHCSVIMLDTIHCLLYI